MSPARVEQARARGPMAVLIGRFSVGARNATFFTAGALGVRPRDVLLRCVIGPCVTVPLVTTLGYLLGEPVVAGLWARARFARPQGR